MKRVISIQDLSCLGKCSQTVALPVLATMGVECAVLPTALFSTHTAFPDFVCQDLSAQMLPIAQHWKALDLHFDAIYTGYLANAQQVANACRVIDLFSTGKNLVFVDPAMADNGKLYPSLPEDFPQTMAQLCARADVIAPNLTEACLLTDTAYRTDFSEEEIQGLLRKLAVLGARHIVLTGVSFSTDSLGIMTYDVAGDKYFSYFTRRYPASFHGTGDLFSSTCVGAMARGWSLEQALTLAADFTVTAIEKTAAHKESDWYGVEFEWALPYLFRRMEE
jgi:pyridoxine kinase